FDEHKKIERPLVIGINGGMLFNYVSFGARHHDDIKAAIDRFLRGKQSAGRYTFISFDDYPKFTLEGAGTSSDFVSELVARIVQPSQRNPLFRSYKAACEVEPQQICDNYRLLQDESIRERIVELLLYARLK